MPKQYAPKYMSRRHPQSPFCSVAYKDDEPKDERTSEELLAEIQKRFDKSLENVATKEELIAIRASQAEAMKGVPVAELRGLLDEKDGVMAIIARQGLEMQRMGLKITNYEKQGEDMSLRGQVERWVNQHKDALAPDIVRRTRNIPSMELRVDSPMHVSTVNAGASPYIGKTQYEGGINDFIRVQPTFWDYIRKGRSSAPTYVWVNKTNALGAAAFIGPGVAKPGVSFSLVAHTSVAKKIADSAKAGTELLQDIDGMVTFIEQELRYKVMIKANEKALVGNATTTPTEITGIRTLSVPFPAGSGLVAGANPTYMDALRAGIGYMRSGLLTGAITVFINPIDAANIDMAKATDSGVYLIPPFATANGQTVAGAKIVEDSSIPVGSVLFAFLEYYRILIYKDFYIDWGWENDDFTLNLVTAIGEMRVHQFFNDIYTGAFMYDTFANIIAAITTPVIP